MKRIFRRYSAYQKHHLKCCLFLVLFVFRLLKGLWENISCGGGKLIVFYVHISGVCLPWYNPIMRRSIKRNKNCSLNVYRHLVFLIPYREKSPKICQNNLASFESDRKVAKSSFNYIAKESENMFD